MGVTSWARFILGILLALESLRLWFMDGTSAFALIVSVVYIIFVAAYFARKIVGTAEPGNGPPPKSTEL